MYKLIRKNIETFKVWKQYLHSSGQSLIINMKIMFFLNFILTRYGQMLILCVKNSSEGKTLIETRTSDRIGGNYQH